MYEYRLYRHDLTSKVYAVKVREGGYWVGIAGPLEPFHPRINRLDYHVDSIIWADTECWTRLPATLKEGN